MRLINKIYNSTPAELVTFLKKKLLRKNDWNFSIEWVLQNQKYSSISSLIDRWERYKRVIKLNINNSASSNLDFNDKVVLELGCGPLLGFAPIAIFNGAKKYYYSEPFLNLETLKSKKIKDKIFRNLYSELTLNYGHLMTFDVFYEKVISCQSIDKINQRIDLTISNSVLEHIQKKDLLNLLDTAYMNSNKGSIYFHSVDFGHHLKGSKHLDRLYINSQNNKLPTLNMLRKSDIEVLLKTTGYINNLVFTYKKGNYNEDKIHDSWRIYEKDNLESRVVFFLGYK